MNTEAGHQITVQPSAFRQFGTVADTFCLVVDEEFANDFSVAPPTPHDKSLIVPIGTDGDLGQLLTKDIPETADVVVICRKTLLTSPDASVIGPGRRIVVLPCASTPVSSSQIRYSLQVVERTDPAAQEARALEFFEAVGKAEDLRIIDGEHESSAEFDPVGRAYVWNQQAATWGPGNSRYRRRES